MLFRHNIADGRLMQTELLGQFCLLVAISVLLADFANVIFAQFRLVPNSSLFRTISHVVGLISQKKVTRSKAGGIVAPMKDINSVRNGTASLNPGLSVNQALALFIPRLQLPIVVRVPSTGPLQARITIGDVLKQFFQQVVTASLVLHLRALQWLFVHGLSGVYASRGLFNFSPTRA